MFCEKRTSKRKRELRERERERERYIDSDNFSSYFAVFLNLLFQQAQ